MKKHLKGLSSNVIGMVGTGATIGAGSQALHSAFGSDYGISQAGAYMPVVGTMVGAKATIGMMGELMPKKKKY